MNRRRPLEHVYLVHGDPTPKEVLAARLRSNLGLEVTIPEIGRVYPL